MKIHCDICGRELGTYLYGKGGVEERAVITSAACLPDVVCFDCLKSKKITNEKSKK
ncbi:MAG: hypothetical protein KAT32_04920 [Candidatus Moranbacteria bacterium]|nr:hypothetical protein [Candidatus Moranbacteria bacterium]